MYIIAVAEVVNKPEWSLFCNDFGENPPRYIGTARYFGSDLHPQIMDC